MATVRANIQGNNRQTVATSRQPGPPAGLRAVHRHADLRTGPRPAGQKDESRSVNAGDLRPRGGVQLSPRPGSSSSRSLTLSFPVTPSVPARPWTCSDNYLRYFPRGPLPLPSSQSTRHKATGWIILKRSAALTLPVTYETKILAFKFPNSFPNNRDYLLWLLF